MKALPRKKKLPKGLIALGGCLSSPIIAFCLLSGFIAAVELGVNIKARDILEADLGDGYVIKVWSEYGEIHESIRYELRLDGSIVPSTYGGAIGYESGDFEYDIQIAYADNGNLVAIYDSEIWERGFFIILDKKHNQFTSIGSSEDWTEQYMQLKEENPEIPLIEIWLEDCDTTDSRWCN